MAGADGGGVERRVRSSAPALVPARMVNEVLYCERLAYLEWVQGEFVDNHFTVEGRHAHRRADRPGGKLPEAAGADEVDGPEREGPVRARSVWLSSARLGLTAKVDVVEGDGDGSVVPVEYKRGAVPDVPHGAYLPERAQVCAQALLLREHGYRCEQGAIYFAKSRRRVAVPITGELVAATQAAIVRAQELAAQSTPPPPLVDSPKCYGCSLSEICLPDEVSLLRRLRGEPELADDGPDTGLEGPLDPDPWQLAGPEPQPDARVRRLYPARDDRVPVYVLDPRSRLRLSGRELVITGPEGAVSARLSNTSQVVVIGNAQITTQALRALFEAGIEVTFLSGGGWLLGRATGVASNNIELRMQQHRRADDASFCLQQARAFVVAKIKNSRTMLRRNVPAPDAVVYSQLSQLARRAGRAEALQALLGIEGAAARVYFSAFTAMLKQPDGLGTFDFESRNRRPPRDPINALLSFAYSLLTRELVHATAGVGLEPLLGFYHQPRFGRPALALDLMEEFRPIVADSVVVTAINTGVVGARDFVVAAGSCNLTAAARRRVVAAFERRMDDEITHPWFGYRISYRRVLEVQARLLCRVISSELGTYPAFTTR